VISRAGSMPQHLFLMRHRRGQRSMKRYAANPGIKPSRCPDRMSLCWRSSALHRPAQRRVRKQACGIERRQRRIHVVHDQRSLGAAEDDGVAALLFHPSDDPLMVSDCVGLEDPVNQLIHDDAIDFFPFRGVRAHIRQSARGESFWIDPALDQPTSPDQAEAPEAALDGAGGDDLGDVQPAQRRSRLDRGKRLVDGVVGTDQESAPIFASLFAEESISSPTPCQSPR
jgi:hypothetical protein